MLAVFAAVEMFVTWRLIVFQRIQYQTSMHHRFHLSHLISPASTIQI